MTAKLGIGATAQSVNITGFTTVTAPGISPQGFPTGLYAGPSNSGLYHRNVFSVVPDVGLGIGYQITQHIRAFVGYDFIYWSSVVRPGSQIDQVVNPNNVAGVQTPATLGSAVVPGAANPGVGPNRPGFVFNATDFWPRASKLVLNFVIDPPGISRPPNSGALTRRLFGLCQARPPGLQAAVTLCPNGLADQGSSTIPGAQETKRPGFSNPVVKEDHLMLKWCTCSLVLPLALLAGAARAADDGWGAPPQAQLPSLPPRLGPLPRLSSSASPLRSIQPLALALPASGSPAASLGSPMPCASPDCPPVPPPVMYDPRVNPVNFETELPGASDIRGQQPDNCFVPPPAPGCGPGCPKFYVDADYMLFAIKNGPSGPPLVTTTTPTALATLPNAGGIGVPGTAVLYNRSQDYGPLSGGRLNAWGWLDCDNILGANVGGFWLQQGSTTRSFASNGAAGTAPLIIPLNVLPTTPFVTPGPNGLGIAAPPVGGSPGGAGIINITSHSELWGAEANAMVNFLRIQGLELNGLAGFRYMSLQEDLTLSTATANNPNVPGSFILFPGAGFGPGIVATQDTFSTRNDFYGAQVGLQARATLGCFFVDLTGKLAMGDSYESLNVYGLTGVNGTNALTGAPVRGLFPGGILALPTNSGHFTKNDFAVVPEVGLKLGYAITKNIRVTVGYDGMYWSSVVRPGDQINPAVDARSIPSSNAVFTPGAAFAGPVPLFKSTDFWRKESRSAWRSRSDRAFPPGPSVSKVRPQAPRVWLPLRAAAKAQGQVPPPTCSTTFPDFAKNTVSDRNQASCFGQNDCPNALAATDFLLGGGFRPRDQGSFLPQRRPRPAPTRIQGGYTSC